MNTTLFLILSLVGCIATAKTSPKIVLSTEELRQIVVDLVRAEVTANLRTNSSSSVPSDIEEQLSGIQRGLHENTQKTEQLIRSYEETLEQAESQCGAASRQLQGDGATEGSNENVTLRQEVLKMSTELENIKEKLETIQLNLLSRQGSSTPGSVSQETSAAPEFFPTAYTTPRDASLTTPNPTVGSSGLSAEEFEAIIRSKPAPSQGNSYNGTSVDVISAQAASRGYQGHYLTVEFANYLNRSIKDFKLHDAFPSAYHHAPKFIPPMTKEIFTFIEPRTGFPRVAFSYRIPNTNVRLATIMKVETPTNGYGVAFVQQDTSMEDYYTSTRGIPGCSEFDGYHPFNSPIVYVVTYHSLRVRTTLTMRAYEIGSLKIELIEAR